MYNSRITTIINTMINILNNRHNIKQNDIEQYQLLFSKYKGNDFKLTSFQYKNNVFTVFDARYLSFLIWLINKYDLKVLGINIVCSGVTNLRYNFISDKIHVTF